MEEAEFDNETQYRIEQELQQLGIYLETASPKQLVDLIDQKFSEGKQKRLSRFSTEWGIWSRQMNLYIRKKIEESEGAPSSILYKYAMMYWVLRSQILELYFKSKITGLGKKNKLKKEAGLIKKTILNPPPLYILADADISMDAIAQRNINGQG